MAKQNLRIPLDIATTLNSDGQTIPFAILLGEDGQVKIDKVLSVRDMEFIRPGASGTRYKCVIGKLEKYLYQNAGQWYVEQ